MARTTSWRELDQAGADKGMAGNGAGAQQVPQQKRQSEGSGEQAWRREPLDTWLDAGTDDHGLDGDLIGL